MQRNLLWMGVRDSTPTMIRIGRNTLGVSIIDQHHDGLGSLESSSLYDSTVCAKGTLSFLASTVLLYVMCITLRRGVTFLCLLQWLCSLMSRAPLTPILCLYLNLSILFLYIHPTNLQAGQIQHIVANDLPAPLERASAPTKLFLST